MASVRITSVQNPRVKLAAKLRESRHRARQQRILVEGSREIDRALAAGIEPLEVFYGPESLTPAQQALVARLTAAGGELLEATPQIVERLSFGDRKESLVVVAQLPTRALADIRLPARPVIGVLAGIEKPGNVGAVARSADGAGLDALIVADSRCDLFAPHAIRASLGTVFTKNVVTASGEEARDWLRGHGVPIVAARLDRAVDYAACELTAPLAIVLGSEATGLSAEWEAPDILGVRLPMHGTADSLNVSAAAAILFYEARRRSGPPGA